MKQGKLQAGNEIVSVEYELVTKVNRGKRETTGTLCLTQTARAELAVALSKLTGANLVMAEGEIRHVEFTRNVNGSVVEFKALPPR